MDLIFAHVVSFNPTYYVAAVSAGDELITKILRSRDDAVEAIWKHLILRCVPESWDDEWDKPEVARRDRAPRNRVL